MNPRTPGLLSELIGLTDLIFRDVNWAHYQQCCETLPKLQAEVTAAAGWGNDPGERPLINETTGILLTCMGAWLREGPFADRKKGVRYLQMMVAAIGFVRIDLGEAMQRAARPTP